MLGMKSEIFSIMIKDFGLLSLMFHTDLTKYHFIPFMAVSCKQQTITSFLLRKNRIWKCIHVMNICVVIYLLDLIVMATFG